MNNKDRKIRSAKTLALLSMSVSLALVLSYLELLIPPIYAAVPGIKMGLANIVIVFVLYRASAWKAASVSLVRVLLVMMLFGNAMALAYSIAGAVLSLLVMILLKKLDLLSPIGVSVAGAVFHNVGQIIMAMLLLGTAELGYYLIVLTVTGTLSGVLIGIAGGIAVDRVPKKLFS
jgi:heptaprenyl diphosphate synthase